MADCLSRDFRSICPKWIVWLTKSLSLESREESMAVRDGGVSEALEVVPGSREISFQVCWNKGETWPLTAETGRLMVQC